MCNLEQVQHLKYELIMTTKKIIVGLIFTVFFAGQIFGQNVGINSTGDSPDPSAMLDVESTDKGFLPPRMTSEQRDAISNPVIGLMIFNTNRLCIEFYVGDNQWTSSTPPGTIKPYAGETSKIPKGWLPCDGRAIDRDDYNDLRLVIGISWGAGDGSETFNIPDLQGQFLRGADLTNPSSAANENRTGGSTTEKIGSLQEGAFQEHQHSVRVFQSGSSNWSTRLVFGDNSYNTSASGTFTDASNGTDMVGSSQETRPKNAYVNYIIKY